MVLAEFDKYIGNVPAFLKLKAYFQDCNLILKRIRESSGILGEQERQIWFRKILAASKNDWIGLFWNDKFCQLFQLFFFMKKKNQLTLSQGYL